jgi:hypothetical protein
MRCSWNRSLQAHLELLTQIAGKPERYPDIGTGAQQPGLGRDHQIVGVRRKRFSNQFLGDIGTVGVGGVDEVDAEVHCATQHADGFLAVLRRPPDTPAGDPHGAESESVDGEIAAEREGSRGLRDGRGGHLTDRTPGDDMVSG